MAYGYDSAENALYYSSPPTFKWTTSQDRNLARELYSASDTLDPVSSDDHGKATTLSDHGQDEWFDNMNKRSAAHISENLFTGEFGVGTDRSYVLAGWKERLAENIPSSIERLSSGNTSVIDQNGVVTGYARDALQSSSLLVATGSDLSAESNNDDWENGCSNFDSREIEASGNETSDGDGGGHNEADDRNPPFDSAQFESMWMGPTPCYLGGCRPEQRFRTSKSWYSHVKNVHKKTLFCLEPGCLYTRPFANNTDLKRHNETKHEANKSFKCERSLCTRTVKAWSRKDKLKHHNSKYHSNYRCFFCSQSPRHERWFDTASELWSHTTSDHRNAELASFPVHS